MRNRAAQPADVLVGHNIRIRRLQRGLSQSELGRGVGVTFQQIQKYEKGANRVGAGRLSQIADVLDIGVPALFEGISTAGRDGAAPAPLQLLAHRHSLRLLQSFHRITNNTVRLEVLRLVETLAQR